MFESTTATLQDGVEYVREAVGSLEDEFQRVQKDLEGRRKKLEKRVASERKAFEKRVQTRRREIEKRTKKFRTEIEKSGPVKRLEALRKDATKQFEQGVSDVLSTLRIASKTDVQRIDRKISQLNRKLREMEGAKPRTNAKARKTA
ncbi:MAG: hypothetical protein AAF430_23720 [Myxococcota bacterium]